MDQPRIKIFLAGGFLALLNLDGGVNRNGRSRSIGALR